jgi:oxygen-independent coproporphyrinogen-3 oxidase
MVMAIAKELQMRKSEFDKEQVETIYFGGGTKCLNSRKLIFYLQFTVIIQ